MNLCNWANVEAYVKYRKQFEDKPMPAKPEKSESKPVPKLIPMRFKMAYPKHMSAPELAKLPLTFMRSKLQEQERDFISAAHMSGRAIDLVNLCSKGYEVSYFKRGNKKHYRGPDGERIDPELVYQLLFRKYLSF